MSRTLLACALLLSTTAVSTVHGATAAPPAAPGDPTEIVPLKKAKLFIWEDFEATDVGKIPKGYSPKGSVGVVDDVAHSGRHSLRLNAAVSGARQIVKQGAEIAAIGGSHWGRLYYKVQLPSPLPAGGSMHTTIVVGAAKSPLDKGNIEVRLMGTSTGKDGDFRYLFNVQAKSYEFGPGAKAASKYSDEWTLAEWYVDYATQTYRFFINGEEIPEIAVHNGQGKFDKSEIPESFESLAFGWQNYQAAAGTGFVAWMDDIAVSRDRIGAQVLIPLAGEKPGKKK
ncbi:MAG: hypothetical protein H0X38_04280 [Planctomycetes bacterium]|nr:hypothetical protein [Planctomycetota bacterium]